MRLLIALLTLGFLLFAERSAVAQWSHNYDAELYSPSLSSDGKYLAVTTENDTLDVYDAGSGKKLWSRPLTTYNPFFTTMFTSKGALLLAAGKSYYFLDPATGKELATLPIEGESWRDLEFDMNHKDPETDTLKPYFVDDIGIFYFDEGLQVVDLAEQKLIYSSPASLSGVKYEKWDNLLMIMPSGADSIYIFNTKEKRLALRFDAYQARPSASLYQHMLVHNDQLLFLTESNILCFDLKTQKRTAIMEVDPDDPDVYIPVNGKDGFYLMVSEDDRQKLYDAKSGAKLWETKEDSVPGYVEQIHYDVNDKDAIIHTYHDDGKIGLYRLAMSDGKVIWSQIVAEQDGSYVSGHKRGSKTMAFIAAAVMQIAKQAIRQSQLRARPGEFGTHNRMMDDMHRRRWRREDRQLWNNLRKSINKNQSSEGYVKTLEINDKTITLLLAGRLYNTIKGSEQKEYDGEGILVLDVKTGKVLKHENFVIVAKNTDMKNVIDDLKTQTVGDAHVTVGYNTVCVVRDDNVEEIPFGESALTYIVSDDTSLVFSVNENEDGDIFDYWLLDPAINPSKKTLIARSVSQNIVFQNPSLASVSFNFTDDEIQAFDPIVNTITPTSFSSPKWKVTEDDLGTLDVGNFSNARNGLDPLNGARITSTGLYLLGSDKIGKVALDGKCRWAYGWEPNLLLNKMELTEIGNTLVFSTGEDCRIMKNNTCEGGNIGKHEIDFVDSAILTDQASNMVILIDKDDGKIHCYPTK